MSVNGAERSFVKGVEMVENRTVAVRVLPKRTRAASKEAALLKDNSRSTVTLFVRAVCLQSRGGMHPLRQQRGRTRSSGWTQEGSLFVSTVSKEEI